MSTVAEQSLSSRLKRTNLTSQLGESLNKEVILAGWVHDVRVLGGISFLLLRDMSGIVQLIPPRGKARPGAWRGMGGFNRGEVWFVGGKVVRRRIRRGGLGVIRGRMGVVSGRGR